MILLAVPLVAYIALFLSILFFVILFIQAKKIKKALQNIESKRSITDLLITDLQANYDQLEKNHAQLKRDVEYASQENLQVSKQLEHRIKVLQDSMHEQQTTLTQIQEQQPEDKLYSRAYKLAALGADIDEIINECGIPRAEAEMLMSVYHKNISSQNNIK